VSDESRHEDRPTRLPPIIDWCSRHGEVVFFAALLLPVLLEGCAIHAARSGSDRRQEPGVQHVRVEVSSVGPAQRPAQRVDLHLREQGRIQQRREDGAF
jgi:hypothetical protein